MVLEPIYAFQSLSADRLFEVFCLLCGGVLTLFDSLIGERGMWSFCDLSEHCEVDPIENPVKTCCFSLLPQKNKGFLLLLMNIMKKL